MKVIQTLLMNKTGIFCRVLILLAVTLEGPSAHLSVSEQRDY
jgi:hypothetical protein